MIEKQYRRGERHVYRNIAGEHLLIALHRDTVAPMFAFTPTAAFLWNRLAAWSTNARLAEQVAEQFEVSLDQAAQDVAGFLEQLSGIGALETRES
ncbi:MAG: PqqD family protein [Anaerolineae bacterium]|nr:PqqD family protein [Gemmatimonadaceae bacterium]